MRNPHQDQSVAQATAGVDVVSGAAQEFAQVGQHIGVAIQAQNAAPGRDRRLGASGRSVKSRHCLLLRFVRIEQLDQVRHLQNLARMLWHIAELQVAARLPSAGQAADDCAQAAAVNESNLAQVQDDGTAIAQQPGYMRAQQLALATRNNPPVAAHDGDATDLASLQG